MAQFDDLIFPGDEEFGEFPPDFIGDDDDEATIEKLLEIRKAVGSPLQPLISDIKAITTRGEAGSLRGIRFTSGADALIWLVTRGIFLFSNVVQMGDGTWGVSIRSSDPPDTAGDDIEEGDDDLIF